MSDFEDEKERLTKRRARVVALLTEARDRWIPILEAALGAAALPGWRVVSWEDEADGVFRCGLSLLSQKEETPRRDPPATASTCGTNVPISVARAWMHGRS